MKVVRSVLALGVAACRFEPGGDPANTGGNAADASLDAVVVEVDAATCPSDYVTIENGRYRHVTAAATWEAALADCADDGDGVTTSHTHLAVFALDSERARVRQTFAGASLWIGLSDRVTTFAWLWVTGENTGTYPPPSGSPWKSGQPTNGSGGRQDCVLMEPDGLWDDRICDEEAAEYVCECDAFAQDRERI